jgi:hypothetical protein
LHSRSVAWRVRVTRITESEPASGKTQLPTSYGGAMICRARWPLLLLAALLACSAPCLAQPFLTNFDSFATGTPAESLNVPGMTFTPSPAGSWVIEPTFFTGLTGQMLYEPTTSGSLVIAFSGPVNSVSFNFAQDSITQGETALVVEAYSGGTLVGSIRQPTTFIGIMFAEASVNFFSVASFDRIKILSDPAATLIAVDNISAPAGGGPPPNLLRVVSFNATPPTIRAGQSTTLSFVTEGATSILIDQGIGAQPASGTVTVAPLATTTYTLTALSGSLTATAAVTVQVITTPNVSVSSFPSALLQAQNAGGATASYTLTNIGGASTTVFLSQSHNFFTQSPPSFSLGPGASQLVTITGTPQAAGEFEGLSIPSGSGVPAGLQVPVRLLSAAPPAGTVTAKPAVTRIDVAADSSSSPSGSVNFTNNGNSALTGVLVSNVPWIVPQSGVITIPAGATVSLTFTIDRTRRPDSGSLYGSVGGSLSLVYFTGAAGKTGALDNPPAGVSISIVTVVDTVQPSVTTSGAPALAPGEVALFVPGVGHLTSLSGVFLSDLSILNTSGSKSIADLKLYYTPAASASSLAKASPVPPMAGSQSLAVADVVKNVFGADQQQGSLQIRSRDADKLSVNANVFNSSSPLGTYGTTIPVFRSDRGVAAGGKLVLTGLRQESGMHTNLYIQETAGLEAKVQTEFVAADGTTLGTHLDTIGPFALAPVFNVVPPGTVSAIMTNTSTTGATFLAFATPLDELSGDTWVVADWSRQLGYAATAETIVPVVGVVHGKNNTFFRTDVAIMNTSTSQASGTLTFVPQSGAVLTRQITLGPRQSSIVADVIGTLFALPSGVGYLVFTPVTGSFAMTSRTYTTVADQPKTFGTHAPAMATAAALKVGSVRPIAGLDDATQGTIAAERPATFRTNFGMMETSGSPATVRVTLRITMPAGTKTTAVGVASKDYPLSGRQFVLLNNIVSEIVGSAARDALGDLKNIEADFQVISGSGSVIVFTSSVDNGTGDSSLRTE